MTRYLLPLVGLAWASLAAGQTTNLRESALPQAGDVELMLEAPPILNATNLSPGTVSRGVFVQTTGNSPYGNTFVGLGINGGVGYYLSDVFEVGGAVAIDYGEPASLPGATFNEFELAVEPFVKENFRRIIKGLHFSPFVQIGVTGGLLTGSAVSSTGLFGFDLDLGVDFLISRGWGISAFIPLALVDATATGTATFTFGVGYGLVTYF